jgi:hypothetical protein
MPPTLYIKNAAKIADDGLGDGTIYATGSGSTADQDLKTFTLAGYSVITDIADVNDRWNGFILYYPASGNKYHVVDWVESSKVATTYEVPNTVDSGPAVVYEIRATLYDDDAFAGNPAFFAVDGFPSIKYKMANPAIPTQFQVCLPNFIGQAGFEELGVGTFPSAIPSTVGTWWSGSDWDVAAQTGEMIGARMAVWGTVSDHQLSTVLTRKLEKGKKYRVAFKAETSSGTSNAGALRVNVRNLNTTASVDPNWETDAWWDVGVIGVNAAWYVSPDLIPDVTLDIGNAYLTIQGQVANQGSAATIRVDEVYMWEKVDVQALAIFNHNLSQTTYDLWGAYVNDLERSNATAADRVQLVSNESISTDGPYVNEISSAIFPIYRLAVFAVSGKTWEAGQILIGEKWPWLFAPVMPFDPSQRIYTENRIRTLSGAEYRYLYNHYRKFAGTYQAVPAQDLAIFRNGFLEHHVKNGEPFGLYWAGFYDEAALFRNIRPDFGTPYPRANFPDVNFDADEVIS